MSFVDDIVKLGAGRFGIDPDPNQSKAIAVSSLSTLRTEKVNTVVKKTNPEPLEETETIEIEVELDLEADTTADIPVVYGDAWVRPLLTDAQLTNNNCTMWYCLTLCEKPGKGIDQSPAEIKFQQIYWNNQKLTFKEDGVTAAAAWTGIGPSASPNLDPNGVITIYCYSGDSDSPVAVLTQGNSVTHGPAYNYMPGWDSTYKMSNLVFAIVRVDYTPAQNIDGIGNLIFKLRNTLRQPGDVMYDYLINPIYGAGVGEDEVDI